MPKLSDIPPCPRDDALRGGLAKPIVYNISLVTPMFGGGAEAGVSDASFPVRGTSIRGQLQFWWRATCGALLATREELFQRQAEIWGKTDTASPVRIEVRDVRCASPRPCAKYEWNRQARGGKGPWRLEWEQPFRHSALTYALFPFQGKKPDGESANSSPVEEPASFIEAASFSLHLQVPDQFRQDIEIAASAWIAFGGLGARTRRGCGSLYCRDLSPRSIGELDQWLRTRAFPKTAAVREWPTLSPTMLVGATEQSAISAWREIIGQYQRFRQGVGFARDEKPGARPGRSRFPEPDAIRKATGQWKKGHEPRASIPHDAFPRAELGLPIVFQFKDKQHGEPPDTQLYPSSTNGEKCERMASPLILKLLALADGRAVAMALRLQAPALQGVVLRRGNEAPPITASSVIEHPKLTSYKDSPLAASPSGSALEAFTALLSQEQGFRKVPL